MVSAQPAFTWAVAVIKRKTEKRNIAGVDMDADFDVWIDRFCLDADLFVWVVNGESTLMRREKAFFEQVAAKLAKPNILVLVNRWVSRQGISDNVTAFRIAIV